jgi:hypothetical protein
VPLALDVRSAALLAAAVVATVGGVTAVRWRRRMLRARAPA